MNYQNQIVCPKCGSNQLSANKKGFSGQKAVAGAILTGGIGLLAGTIGSNKIIITCLNCGHQFKPGERPTTTTTVSSKNDGIVAAVVILIFIGLIILLIRGCSGGDNKSYVPSITDSALSKEDTTKNIVESVKKPNINYEVIKEQDDNTGSPNMLYVYVKNAKRI